MNVFLEKQKEKRRINQNSRDELLLFDDALSTYAAYAGPQEGIKIGGWGVSSNLVGIICPPVEKG